MTKKSQDETLDKLVQGRCTSAEYEAFVQKAEMDGLKISQAVRALIIKYIGSNHSINPSDAKMLAIEKKVKELEERQRQTEETISVNLGELVA